MAGLETIPIRVEGLDVHSQTTHNVLPVLHEIRHALARLGESGDATTIDLSSIPFAPGDRSRLFEALGEGEVSATLQAMGETRIRESAYPGVWLVQHFSPQGDELATHIEITRMPALLITPEADVTDAIAALGAQLATEDTQDN